jgi:predicted O-methyltransferase YrrM
MPNADADLPAVPAITWIDDPAGRDLSSDVLRFEVGGTRLLCGFGAEPAVGLLPVLKSPALLDAYVERLAPYRGGNVVELGVRHGGSTALLAALLTPRSLVALELATDPLPLLDRFLADHHLTDVVRVHLGVDQSNSATVGQVVDDGLDGQIDLVVDDASHLYEPTRSSFLTLFPRLRPGGLYVIEDWSASLVLGSASADDAVEAFLDGLERDGAPPLLERLTLELVLAAGVHPDLIAGVSADRHWTVVTRGPGSPDLVRAALEDALEDPIRLLAPRR